LTEGNISPDFSTFTSNQWTELWKGLNSSTNINIATMSTVTLPPFNGSELLNNVGSVAQKQNSLLTQVTPCHGQQMTTLLLPLTPIATDISNEPKKN
jgi:hypothetical protein